MLLAKVRRTTKEARDVEARYSWDSESDGKAVLVGVGGGGACGGVNQLLTFYEFPRAMWKSIRTTNALENLNREFRRRTKTQASFSSEESAVALLFGLIASGQIQLRRIDGYQRLSEVLEHAKVTA